MSGHVGLSINNTRTLDDRDICCRYWYAGAIKAGKTVPDNIRILIATLVETTRGCVIFSRKYEDIESGSRFASYKSMILKPVWIVRNTHGSISFQQSHPSGYGIDLSATKRAVIQAA